MLIDRGAFHAYTFNSKLIFVQLDPFGHALIFPFSNFGHRFLTLTLHTQQFDDASKSHRNASQSLHNTSPIVLNTPPSMGNLSPITKKGRTRVTGGKKRLSSKISMFLQLNVLCIGISDIAARMNEFPLHHLQIKHLCKTMVERCS